mgnify:CR=1 FL=1
MCSLDLRQALPQEVAGNALGVAPWAAIPVRAPASPYTSVPLVSAEGCSFSVGGTEQKATQAQITIAKEDDKTVIGLTLTKKQ